MKYRLSLAICAILLTSSALPSSAQEEPQGGNMITSGTGFFVSNRGHIITNEHVVRGCSEVGIRGAVEKSKATVLSIDTTNDLALLQTDAIPPRLATISNTKARLRVGEPVLVMGYPLEHGMTGEYATVPSHIISLDGPTGEDKWIEFASSAEHGNSGGPLLDSGGNVVGVIVGKATLTKLNYSTQRQQEYKHSDVAISLDVLESFLKQNNVFYRTQASGFTYSSNRVENIAKDYIVNIHCPDN